MIYDEQLIDTLQSLDPVVWQGLVYRHMFANNDPLLENRRGARWNPPETPAIYACLERETALAEAEHLIASQPYRPQARRTVYTMDIKLSSVLDITDPATLARVGLQSQSLADTDWSQCQRVGGATEWLGHDGLLIPSVRSEGTNLIIYPNKHDLAKALKIISTEVISE